jgi:hypothetical protein
MLALIFHCTGTSKYLHRIFKNHAYNAAYIFESSFFTRF